ncbi:MAG: hypothetical protein J5590_02815 [Clostridia bacterium]|nr:hypothetical protein [Clostridia bacterium]
MISVIYNYDEIVKYQAELKNELQRKLSVETTNEIGFPGGAITETVYSDPNSGLWCSMADDLLDGNRFWNPFGIDNPTKNKHITPLVEINIPAYLDRRVGGVFLKDDDNNVYLGHRGKIGGGKEGVGKGAFFDKYSGKIVDAVDETKNNPIAIISCIYDNNLIFNINRFIYAVGKIKNIKIFDESTFSPEPTYRKQYLQKGKITPATEHASVVNALAEHITNNGDVPFNTREIDLYVLNDNGSYKTIYEVKSKTDTQSIYTGIGQLCYHSLMKEDVEKILVLPKSVSRRVTHTLKKLNINVMTYEIINQQIVFK